MLYKGRKIKIALLLVIVVALMFSTIWMMMTKASEDSEHNFQGSYTIEYLIKNYNLVTLNNVEVAEHIVGPILVGGDIKSALCHSQITNNISSYIKGKITNGGNVQPPPGQSTPTLYLGLSNEVQTFDNLTTNVNGVWYTNSPVVVTDEYINFDSLYGSVKSQANGLATGTIVEPDESGKIEIAVGETVTIESLDKVSVINITGNMNSSDVTLINIKQSGNINFPKVTMNSNQVTTSGSSSAGVAIVWNLPNASKVNLTNDPFIGHLIAPDADLTGVDTNYAGCFIVKSLSGHIEGHFYPYNNGELPIFDEPEEDPDNKEPEGEDPKEDPDNKEPEREDPKEDPDNKEPEEEEPKENPDNREPEEKDPKEDPDNREPQNDTEDPIDRNTSKGNKTNKVDNTISKTKLPQTGEELNKTIILVAILIIATIIFGIKYILSNNKFDANK